MSETPEKRARIAMLFDFYSALLSDRQRQIASMYYMDDMSLAEISDELGITRQGVHDAVKKSEIILTQTEDKLMLAGKFRSLADKLGFVTERLKQISLESGMNLNDIIEAVDQITENI